MRKQVNYHPLNSIYGPYGGRTFICIGYHIWNGQLCPFKTYQGSQNFEIGPDDLGHAN